MPIKSRWTCEIPNVSLTTYLFGSPTAELPDRPVFIDAERSDRLILTFLSYRLWCQRFAAGLRAKGFKDGDAVLLFSSNTLFTPVVIHGTIMAGGIFTGANPTFVPRELAYQLTDSGAKFLIASDALLDTARKAAKEIGMDEDRIFAFDDGAASFEGKGRDDGNIRHWTSILADEETGRKFAWENLTTPDELSRTVALNYSSGTTGVPKGVMITHRNYVANCSQTAYMARLDPQYDEKIPRARALCFLPMYHAYGQAVHCVGSPKRGVPVYIMGKFDFMKMLKYVQEFRVTGLSLVPPVIVAMAKHPDVKKFDLSSVEYVGCGAAPLGREISVEFEKLWPNGKINVKQGWGMTELTCSAIGWSPLERVETFAVGELNPNCEAMIMNVEGTAEVPQGERGEIWVRAPNVMKGYWKKPRETENAITAEGWLKTGDIAYIDKENKFYVVDRVKELIKVKGNQVAPAELEALLLDHPAIADVAVIGVRDAGDEEYPRAYVVLKQGSKATEDEIKSWTAERVARHKRLTGGVHYLDVIPKNPSGKILRKQLRDKAEARA